MAMAWRVRRESRRTGTIMSTSNMAERCPSVLRSGWNRAVGPRISTVTGPHACDGPGVPPGGVSTTTRASVRRSEVEQLIRVGDMGRGDEQVRHSTRLPSAEDRSRCRGLPTCFGGDGCEGTGSGGFGHAALPGSDYSDGHTSTYTVSLIFTQVPSYLSEHELEGWRKIVVVREQLGMGRQEG